VVTFESALDTVLRRAQAKAWSGADPYDGLLSPLGRCAIRLGPMPRMAVTQATLRSNLFRKITRPPGTINPKGLGLFLGAVLRGRDTLGSERMELLGNDLLDRIAGTAIRNGKQASWGYPFPWQSRFLWAPAGTPNAVATATVGWYLLDWADEAQAPPSRARLARELGNGAALFLSETLHYTPVGERGTAVSYTTGDRSRIVNVSMLAARLLKRVARDRVAGQTPAVSSAHADQMGGQAAGLLQFGLSEQREDGTWPYSAEMRGGWVDSFHTGFVLESLLDLRAMGAWVPEKSFRLGLDAYRGFFDPDGGARFLLRADSPLDAHSAAQGIVTYAALAADTRAPQARRKEARQCALRIARWSLDRLWLERRGHFAYRIQGERRNEQEYTRWVQAWMALGMSVADRMERIQELASA
jgi:hypothetical protein